MQKLLLAQLPTSVPQGQRQVVGRGNSFAYRAAEARCFLWQGLGGWIGSAGGTPKPCRDTTGPVIMVACVRLLPGMPGSSRSASDPASYQHTSWERAHDSTQSST